MKERPMKFMVSSLGEVFLGNTQVGGSIDLKPIIDSLPPKDQKRFTCARVRAKVDRLANKRMSENLRMTLSGSLYELTRRIYRLQMVNDARFRVYGGNHKGKDWIKLTTEFQWWVSDEKFWVELSELAERIGATVEIMDESPHLDRSSKDGGKTWVMGSHHGRKERQVALAVDVLHCSLHDVNVRIDQLKKETRNFWKKAGVAVI
jgi:hypothetical protein